MEEFDYRSEYGGYTTCEDLLLEVQNTHKIVQNLRINKDIAELSTYVNHLVFLHLYRMWIWKVLMENILFIYQYLGRCWDGIVFYKNCNQKKIGLFYKTMRWRYYILTNTDIGGCLLFLSRHSPEGIIKNYRSTWKLIKICKEMPIEIWEE